ncbi:ABC transporter permease [bacterium]|nr:ABC transporter permease [bacterium]
MKNKGIKAAILKERNFFLSAPALLWQIIFFYIPIVFIVAVSVLHRLDYSIFDNITFSHYAILFDSSYYKIILRSVVLAFTNATLCFLVAYPVAYFLVFKTKHLRNLLLFLLVLPFWANFLVQVYAWFFILERGGFLNSILLGLGIIAQPLHLLNSSFAIYVVMLFCYLPFMIMPIYSSLEKINKSVFEASSDLGASTWQTILRVILPLSSSGIRTGFFLVFIPSFGEFIIPALLGGGKKMYVGSLISYFFLETRNVFLGAAFTCLSSAVLLVSIFVLNLLLRKFFGRDRV